MRWDRIVACLLIVVGLAYASYTGINYIYKMDVVKEISPDKIAKVDISNQVKTPNKKTLSEPDWVIVPKEQRPKKGEAFANLIIPRLKESMPIIEGTDEDDLSHGVGHYQRSVLPGEPDNSVLSGHRDITFQRLGELKKGDQLQVATKQGTFVYRIDKIWITHANDQSVIVPHKEPTLTLTTCYPFGYFGSAPDRYIVQGKLMAKLD